MVYLVWHTDCTCALLLLSLLSLPLSCPLWWWWQWGHFPIHKNPVVHMFYFF